LSTMRACPLAPSRHAPMTQIPIADGYMLSIIV
jgi:hypothetical protein